MRMPAERLESFGQVSIEGTIPIRSLIPRAAYLPRFRVMSFRRSLQQDLWRNR